MGPIYKGLGAIAALVGSNMLFRAALIVLISPLLLSMGYVLIAFCAIWLIDGFIRLCGANCEARSKFLLTVAPLLIVAGALLIPVLYHAWPLEPGAVRFGYHYTNISMGGTLITGGLICFYRSHQLTTGQLK